MRKSTATRFLALIALLAAGCGPATNPVSQATSSPSQNATPTPARGQCDSTHRCLALVTLRGSDNLVVRDISDLDHPSTVANLGPVTAVGGYGEAVIQFVSATELTSLLNGGIVKMPLSGSPKTPVPGSAKDAAEPAWSPDGTSVAYTTQRGSYESGDVKLDVHLLSSGTDRIVGSTPGLGIGGCEYIASCTLPNWLDVRLAFSPDGQSFSFVAEGFGASFFRVWSSDGTLLKSIDTQSTTMSAWSSQTLYFRDGGGVEAWKAGANSTFLPGVAWIKPSASPAGGTVVYTVRDAAGWGHIYLVDTSTGQTHELKAQRTDAVFLTSRYVWYRGERACVEADQCGPNPPFHPGNGKTYIYDLQTGTEYESVITNVYDAWPHAA
jgi:WD40 repeat protein